MNFRNLFMNKLAACGGYKNQRSYADGNFLYKLASYYAATGMHKAAAGLSSSSGSSTGGSSQTSTGSSGSSSSGSSENEGRKGKAISIEDILANTGVNSKWDEPYFGTEVKQSYKDLPAGISTYGYNKTRDSSYAGQNRKKVLDSNIVGAVPILPSEDSVAETDDDDRRISYEELNKLRAEQANKNADVLLEPLRGKVSIPQGLREKIAEDLKLFGQQNHKYYKNKFRLPPKDTEYEWSPEVQTYLEDLQRYPTYVDPKAFDAFKKMPNLMGSTNQRKYQEYM